MDRRSIDTIDPSPQSPHFDSESDHKEQSEINEIEQHLQQAKDGIQSIIDGLPDLPLQIPKEMLYLDLYKAICDELLLRARFHNTPDQVTFNIDDGKDFLHGGKSVKYKLLQYNNE